MVKTAPASKEKNTNRTPRERIAAALHSRFALRFHTSILLLWMFSAGLLTTKGLFALGVQSMFLRYTIAIVVAYGAFLLGVRIWLAYVGAGRGNARQADSTRPDSAIDLPNFSSSGGSSGGGSPNAFGGGGGTSGGGGGGTSGGGGASASFDGDVASSSNLLAMDGAGLSASSSSGGDSGILSDVGGKVGDVVGDIGGGDDGCLIAFAVMIVVGLVALAIGGAFFVISMGPEILIDAAFNAMLAGGLIKAGKKMSDPDWFGSVINGTWVPLAMVLVIAWIFTFAAALLTPKAHTFGAVWRAVWPLLLESI